LCWFDTDVALLAARELKMQCCRFLVRRRYLVWIYVGALHAAVAALVIYPNGLRRLARYWCHDPSVMEEYQGMVRAQAVVCAGMPEGAVLFLGDSRMRELPVRDVVSDPAINLSIGGDTTKGLLGRLGRYPRLETARRIVVGVGVNDLSHFDDQELLGNYRKLLETLNARGTWISVTSILPINESKYSQANASFLSGQRVTNGRIASVNREIEEACRTFSYIEFVDVNAALVGPDGNLRDEYSADGLHLNSSGNVAWAAALKLALARP
jgi:lysophospholipase L1-like esterase